MGRGVGVGELIGDGCAGGGGRSKTARARAGQGQGQGEGDGVAGGGMRRTANPALLVPDATVVTLGDGTNHVLLLRRLWACVSLRASNWTTGVICGRIVVSWESWRVGVWERNGGGAEEVFR